MNSFSENPESQPAVQSPAADAYAVEPPPPDTPDLSADPAWNAWDLVKLVSVTLVALLVSMVAALILARSLLQPRREIADLARTAVVAAGGQGLAYLLVFAYMYFLVTREKRRPAFLQAIHWNWPANPSVYVLWGMGLSVGLQLLGRFLPIPKNLPIDNLFRTPLDAWVLTIFGIAVAPLMEELLFRGFLYPVLQRGFGMGAAVVLTAGAFALVHGSQLKFSWGPLLLIFLVGLALTYVRAKKDSVAAALLLHISYNSTISALLFAATDGFRHLDKMPQ